MKKLFTLVALLAVFMGAKAEWVEDYSYDYSQKTAFPFYVMGYVPEWVDGVMTDYGAQYGYKTDAEMEDFTGGTEVGTVTNEGGTVYHKVQLDAPGWHQYFIADNIPTELDGSYKVTAMVKASEAVTINVNMGWGWGEGQTAGASVQIGTDWAEVEWEYSGIGGTSCNLVAQPGGSTATIEWKWLKVSHNAKAQRPTVWQQWLTNDGNPIIPDVATESKYMGDAETAWPAWALEKTPEGVNINWRGERTGEICAWALTMGRNYQESVINDDSPRARPYPADIEAEEGNPTNHVFAIHVDQIAAIDNGDKEPDNNSIQWSNQFWIQSPKGWKEGTQVRIKFRYKAKVAAKAATQIHKKNPSNYLHWNAVGDVNFTTEWQDFDKTITFDGSQATGWSLAFNLCAESTVEAPQEPNIFYFDDLSWETMKLDEGYFLAGCNTETGLAYDLDNAVEFVDEEGVLVATAGEAKNVDSYVNEIMISTVRGNDAAFKGATLKPTGTIKNDPDEWLDYSAASVAKLKLPGSGVWKVYLDTGYSSMAFEMLEGVEKTAVDIVTNETEMVVNATERDWKPAKDDGTPQDGEDGVGTGQPWDNQFWIAANRDLNKDEVTVLKFKYKAKNAARTSTQAHKVGGDGMPCTYLNWQAIGDVNFTEEWQDFSTDFTVPAGDDGMRSFTFNLSEVKAANDYYFKDVQWYLKDESLDEGKTYENLIDAEGTKNFFVKVGAGTAPYQYVTDPSGIANVAAKGAKTSAVMYNLAGQRVANSFKGIVVKDGKKFVK